MAWPSSFPHSGTLVERTRANIKTVRGLPDRTYNGCALDLGGGRYFLAGRTQEHEVSTCILDKSFSVCGSPVVVDLPAPVDPRLLWLVPGEEALMMYSSVTEGMEHVRCITGR